MPKKKTVKPDKSVPKKVGPDVNRKQYYLPTFLLLLIIVLGVVSFTIYSLSNDSQRDLLRRQAIDEIVQVVDSLYLANNKYPEAVFFTEDRALICTQVDCFQQTEVTLKGAARSVTDMSQTTTSKSTKYGYVLDNGVYSIGYCDENGEIQSFGNAGAGSLLLNCN